MIAEEGSVNHLTSKRVKEKGNYMQSDWKEILASLPLKGENMGWSTTQINVVNEFSVPKKL